MLKRQSRQDDGTGMCFPALGVLCVSFLCLYPPAGPSRFLIMLAEYIGTAYSSHIVHTCLYVGCRFLSYPPCPPANANPHSKDDWVSHAHSSLLSKRIQGLPV